MVCLCQGFHFLWKPVGEPCPCQFPCMGWLIKGAMAVSWELLLVWITPYRPRLYLTLRYLHSRSAKAPELSAAHLKVVVALPRAARNGLSAMPEVWDAFEVI